MKDSINIGCSPADEPCAQAGRDSVQRMKAECNALIGQLRRMYGEEPEGARLFIKGNPHDYGTYYEVECEFSDEHPESLQYALKCEDLPENWDAQAIAELKARGFTPKAQNEPSEYQGGVW